MDRRQRLTFFVQRGLDAVSSLLHRPVGQRVGTAALVSHVGTLRQRDPIDFLGRRVIDKTTRQEPTEKEDQQIADAEPQQQPPIQRALERAHGVLTTST
jgi:hypothetical protein